MPSYPGSIFTTPNPLATDSLGSATVPHDAQHTNINNEVVAIETELGTLPSGAYANVAARLSDSVLLVNDQTIAGIKTFSNLLIHSASTTSVASMRIPHGVAPTTPVNGDVWSTTADYLIRISGVTRTIIHDGKAAASVTTLTGLQSAIVGTSTNFARQDHQHSVAGLVDFATAQTLTNKTLSDSTNVFPTSLATLTGIQTLTNKTISGASNTLSAIPSSAVTGLDTHTAATAAHGAAGAVVGTTSTQTLTNKTISGASNTLSAIPSSAVTGLDTHTAATAAHGAAGAVVGTTSTQTLTNKTLSSPTFSGTVQSAITSTSSFSGTAVLANPANGEITLAYGGSGGVAIAQGSVATHPNGIVLWVSGNSLYVRHSNGADGFIN